MILALGACSGSGTTSPEVSSSGGTGDESSANDENPTSAGTQGDDGDEGENDSGGGDDGPDPIPPTLPPGSCGLDEPAFCETFESSHPGGRAGDLDETVWSFSRWAHAVQYMWLRTPAATYDDRLYPATFCGEDIPGLLPPDDVRICDGAGVDGTVSGQLNEVFDDQGDFAFHSMRIRQPFDFTDRTGTVVWDVDAKVNPHNVGHGWWIEVWITEDPSPMPYHEAPSVIALPRTGLGLAFRFGGGCEYSEAAWGNTPETAIVVEDYAIRNWYDDLGWLDDRCFRSMDAQLNHLELRISKDTLELWATDFGDPDSLQLRGMVTDLDLPFERGYVHFQHAHYNASKDGLEGCEEGVPNTCPTPVQTFRWDNIGFDGPTYPVPRGYDVANNDESGPEGGVYIGWYISDGEARALDVPGVDLSGATAATFNFDVMMATDQSLDYRFNGGPWHNFAIPNPPSSPNPETGLRGYSVPVDLAELVDGDNRIEVRAVGVYGGWVESIGNVDLTIEAAP